jgi:hypothetical protein
VGTAPPLTKDFPQNAEGPGDGWNPLSAMPGTLTNKKVDAMNTVRVLAAAAVAAMVVAAPTAAADPTPGPAYQIRSNAGPVLGGVQTYQPPPAWRPRWPVGSGTTLALGRDTREETSKPYRRLAAHFQRHARVPD